MNEDTIQNGSPGVWPSRRRNASDTARDIYQDLLDKIGRALREDSFEDFLTYFTVPSRIETEDQIATIETREDYLKLFRGVRDTIVAQDIPELTRDCTIAEFVGPHRIQGCHETRLITRGLQIRESYSALSTMVRGPSGWQVSHSQFIGGSGASMPNRLTRALSD